MPWQRLRPKICQKTNKDSLTWKQCEYAKTLWLTKTSDTILTAKKQWIRQLQNDTHTPSEMHFFSWVRRDPRNEGTGHFIYDRQKTFIIQECPVDIPSETTKLNAKEERYINYFSQYLSCEFVTHDKSSNTII